MSKLTPQQDLAVREFYVQVAQDPVVWGSDPVGQRDVMRKCLDLLDYFLIKGKYVRKNKIQNYKFGQEAEYTCTWDEDTRAMEAKLYAEDRRASAIKTDSSKPSQNPTVRKAVLPEEL